VRTIALVAGAVFRESVRDRVPYSMVVFAALLMAASYLISQLTAGQDMKIIKDLGLAAISWFGLLIAIFIGINLVSKEVERRSVYALLAKPVTRGEFVLGKYAGLVFTLIVNLSAMTLAFTVVLFYMDAVTAPAVKAGWPAPALDPRLLVAVVLTIAELAIVTAIALFFSTFSSPLLAALLTFGLWVAGHFNQDLRNFEAVLDFAPVVWLGRALYFLLPNLAPFNIRAEVVHGIDVAARSVLLTLAYAAVYIAILLVASIAVFRRRDFK
jgi:ABC-type transport system involved in multi-copper enzyme maturation permease subunit